MGNLEDRGTRETQDTELCAETESEWKTRHGVMCRGREQVEKEQVGEWGDPQQADGWHEAGGDVLRPVPIGGGAKPGQRGAQTRPSGVAG